MRLLWTAPGYHQSFAPPEAFVLLDWKADETAFIVAIGYGEETWGAFNLDGAFTPFPPDAEFGPPFATLTPASGRASVRCDAEGWCAVLLDGEGGGRGALGRGHRLRRARLTPPRGYAKSTVWRSGPRPSSTVMRRGAMR